MTQSVHGDDQEETKADAAERGEDWLYADRADYINEQQRAEHEGQRLRPGHGAPGARRPADRVRLGRFDQRVIVEMFLGNQNLNLWHRSARARLELLAGDFENHATGKL